MSINKQALRDKSTSIIRLQIGLIDWLNSVLSRIGNISAL